jgi:hypothetical protein
MSPNRINDVDDLEKLLAEKDEAILALGNLVRGMDARIKLLTELVDAHHEIFIRQGICKPRPTEDHLVN